MNCKKFIPFLIAILIASSLINTGTFGAGSLTAFVFYLFSISVLCCSTLFVLITGKDDVYINRYFPVAAFVLFVFFFFCKSFINNGGLTPDHLLLSGNCLLLICCAVIFSTGLLKPGTFFNLVIFFSLTESIICILQYTGCIKSQNSFFRVTGSWVNPNVTAIFMAMSIPAIGAIILQRKKLGFAALLLVLTGIILLKCRTALIGAFVTAAILITAASGIIKKVKERLSFLERLMLCIGFLLISAPVVFYGYKAKQASADGRMLVWKISANMISHKPLTGYGYGMFKREYNLFQAKYFESGKGTRSEINNASFVKMAYNDFLEVGVEGGIIALILLIAFFVTLLFPPGLADPQKKGIIVPASIIAYSGIAAFVIMSVFNFSMKAIPAMALFIMYSSLLVASPSYVSNKRYFFQSLFSGIKLTARPKYVLACILILAGLYSGVKLVAIAKAYRQTSIAGSLLQYGNYSEALEMLEPLEADLRYSENFLKTYGKVLLAKGYYSYAISQFNQALMITSDPEIFILKGDCYTRLKNAGDARQAYTSAINIAPARMAGRYALMNLYMSVNDSVNAIKTANQLLSMHPKVVTKQSSLYIKAALAVKNNIR